MAVNNTLSKKADKGKKIISFDSGGKEVTLSADTVRRYLVSGGGSVTDQEIVMFINLCKYQNLNPFLREAYLIKFGNSPATIVTGKDVYVKRAKRNEHFQGFQAGIIAQKQDGEIENRMGAFCLPDEEVVGGWAKVFIDNFEVPVESTVSIEEYIGRKNDGTVNGQWAKKPATMIRKVALVQALREAFPEDFQGMYSQEESGVDVTLDETPIVDAPQDPPKKQEKIEAEIVPESTPEPYTDDDNPFAD